MGSSSYALEVHASEKISSTGLAYATGFFFSMRSLVVLVAVEVFGAEARTGSVLVLLLELMFVLCLLMRSDGRPLPDTASLWRTPAGPWVLAYLGLALCSLFWSETVSLPTSAAYWCGLCGDVVITFLLFRSNDVQVAAESLMKGFITATCLASAAAWLMPLQSDFRLGNEVFFNTNQIGNLCAFGVFFAQYLLRRKQQWSVKLGGIFLAVTLLRSLSKTTIVAFVAAELVLLLRDRSTSRKAKLLLVSGGALAVLLFWGLIGGYLSDYASSNSAESLTGRTSIWAYCFTEALEKPWLGHGFDSMWKVVPPFGPDQFQARHAENELLQQFYTYGLAGIVLLIALYGSLFRATRRLLQGNLRVTLTCVLCFVFVRGLAEAEPFDLLLPVWMVVMLSQLVREGDQLAELR